MLKSRMVGCSLVVFLSGMATAQTVSTFPPGSPLYEAVKENLLQNGDKDLSPATVNQHIQASAVIAQLNEELVAYFSDRHMQSEIDNTRAGYPSLKVYVKNLRPQDRKYIASQPQYALVTLVNSQLNNTEAAQINQTIGETLAKDANLLELVYSGHYDPATDRFIVKTLTDDTSELEAALQPLKQRFKIRIAYLKVEGPSAVRPRLLRAS
ncbi:hypothetical protein ACQYWY_00760 [Comamonas sediminis]|uniref:hypothetical protein n=1 Tax=Comamonas sediminis TaxID=1783360 RepID=UPI003D2DE922